MSIATRWIANSSASALHAAAALLRGMTLADERLAAALEEPAAELGREIEIAGLARDPLLEHLISLAAGIENNRELVQVALNKTVGVDHSAEVRNRLTGRITDVEGAVRRALPTLVDDLALRGGPLRELWDARGPGMLAAAGRIADEGLIVSRADVVLVHPALGGAGVAHLRYNSVRIEAVLANPDAELPEVARLGWLLLQLNLDVPAYSETIPPGRLPRTAALAMIPVALSAAEKVELVRADEPTIRRAAGRWPRWHGATPTDADTLAAWWRTYTQTRPRWPVALAALDKML